MRLSKSHKPELIIDTNILEANYQYIIRLKVINTLMMTVETQCSTIL